MFHAETIRPRSLCDHQWTISRPQGGHPIPWNQPFKNSMMNMMAMLEVAQRVRPRVRLTAADITRPSGRKKRAFDRSDTLPIRNFDRP